MEPIPETDEALGELERYGDEGLREDLRRLTALAQVVVPGLVGVSVSLFEEELVLTFVASDVDIAALDAVQYVDDGPCLEAIRQDEIVTTDAASVLDESSWRLFAQVTAATGVRSTLSMPIRSDDVVTGGLNFYGNAPNTFEGHVDHLAALFDGWAAGAVSNADLSFSTRLDAARSPGRLRDRAYVDQAVGLLVAARGLEPLTAEERLTSAAAQAGVPVPVLAHALVETFDPKP